MKAGDSGSGAAPDPARATARLFRDGDLEATRRVRAKVARVVAFRGYGIPAEDRLDLEQVIVSQLWEAVRRPDFDGDGFWGLVEVVGARRCIDWRRTRKVTVDLESIQGVSDPRSNQGLELLESERLDLARRALASLPRPCRELIERHAGLNMTYAEIADSLGKSEGALRVQMHRCIAEARKTLAELLAPQAGKKSS